MHRGLTASPSLRVLGYAGHHCWHPASKILLIGDAGLQMSPPHLPLSQDLEAPHLQAPTDLTEPVAVRGAGVSTGWEVQAQTLQPGQPQAPRAATLRNRVRRKESMSPAFLGMWVCKSN